MIKEHLQMYKEMYYHELDMKEKINSRVSIPLGIITILVSATFCIIKVFYNIPKSSLKSVCFILLILYSISLIAAIISVIYSYYGYEYHYLPKPRQINNYIESIKNYYEDNYEEYFSQNDISKQDLILNDINNFFIDKYITTTEHNQKLNFKKLTGQRYTIFFIIITILMGTIFFPLYMNLKSKVDDNVIKIEIKTNVQKIKKGRLNNDKITKNKANSTTKTNTTTDSKNSRELKANTPSTR